MGLTKAFAPPELLILRFGRDAVNTLPSNLVSQDKDDEEMQQKADIFSLGVTFLFLLFGKTPMSSSPTSGEEDFLFPYPLTRKLALRM